MVGLYAGAEDAGDGGDQPERADVAVERGVLGAEVAAGPGLDAGHAVPGERAEVVPDRMHGDLARHGADAAADGHRRHVQLAALQPFGRAHVVAVGPRTGRGLAGRVPGQGSGDDDLLPELVEHDGAGEGLVAAQRGDDVGLVALGLAGEIEAQLVRPGRTDGAMRQVAGGVQPAAQLRHLLVEHRHGDAGPGLDPREDLALGQRIEPGEHEAAEEHAERGHVGRVGQRLGGGFQIGHDGHRGRSARSLGG